MPVTSTTMMMRRRRRITMMMMMGGGGDHCGDDEGDGEGVDSCRGLDCYCSDCRYCHRLMNEWLRLEKLWFLRL